MDKEEIKSILRCNDDDLIETHGPNACNLACAAVDALHADAKRYRAVCALVCETDKAKQARMLDAVDNFQLLDDLATQTPTPELFAGFVDAFIAALEGARDADRQV